MKTKKIKDFEIKMKMQLYTLTKDTFNGCNESNKKGRLLLASFDQFDILLEFWKQFNIDTFGNDPKLLGTDESYKMRIESFLKDDSIFLWKLIETNEIVSMCVKTGYTPNGFRIGIVYTPLNHRKNGYGTSVTGNLCQKIFDDGGSYCCLFADCVNPTSNKIYKSIGFQEKSLNEIHRFIHFE